MNEKTPSPIGDSLPLSVGAPVPEALTDDQVFDLIEASEREFRRAQRGIRGQLVMPSDDPRYCLVRYVLSLAAAPTAPVSPRERNEGGGDAVAAWRGVNELGEVVTEWQDGAPPAILYDLCGSSPTNYASVQVAYTHPAPTASEIIPTPSDATLGAQSEGGLREAAQEFYDAFMSNNATVASERRQAVARDRLGALLATPPAPDAAGRAAPPPAAPEPPLLNDPALDAQLKISSAKAQACNAIIASSGYPDTPAAPEQSSAQPWEACE